MDIPRPELKRRKRTRQLLVGGGVAADELGVSRSALCRRMEKFGLRRVVRPLQSLANMSREAAAEPSRYGKLP